MIARWSMAMLLLVFMIGNAVGGEAVYDGSGIVEGKDFRGVTFSLTPEELPKLLPGAALKTYHPGHTEGIRTYELRNDVDYDCVLLRFSENALIEIDFIYFPKRVAAKGGADALKTQALEVFGAPTTQTDHTLLWDFPQSNRMVVAFYVNQKWSLHVYDRARRLKIPRYQDTTVSIEESGLNVFVGPAVPGPISPAKTTAIPHSVMDDIQRNALLEHPTSPATQNYVVDKDVQAFETLENYRCPAEMQPRVFEFLLGRVRRDHPHDYSTQLYVLNRQVAAFEELRSMKTPTGVARSHYYVFRRHAANRHPYDYSVQLFVLKRYIDDYLMYRTNGNSGDAIVNYLLRNG
jgi:hypothetical protein